MSSESFCSNLVGRMVRMDGNATNVRERCAWERGEIVATWYVDGDAVVAILDSIGSLHERVYGHGFWVEVDRRLRVYRFTLNREYRQPISGRWVGTSDNDCLARLQRHYGADGKIQSMCVSLDDAADGNPDRAVGR